MTAVVDGKTTADICLKKVFAGELGESTTAPKPCCAGTSDGACGSAVVALDSDAGLNAAAAPSSPLPPELRPQQLVAVLAVEQLIRDC